MSFELRAFGNGVFRIHGRIDGVFSDTLLSRYGLIREPEAMEISDSAVTDGASRLTADGGTLTLIDDIKAGHIGCEYGEFES